MNKYEAERIEEIRVHIRREMEYTVKKHEKDANVIPEYTKGYDEGVIRTCKFILGMLRISTFYPYPKEDKK